MCAVTPQNRSREEAADLKLSPSSSSSSFASCCPSRCLCSTTCRQGGGHGGRIPSSDLDSSRLSVSRSRRDEEEGTGEGLSGRCCESKNDDSREEPGGSNSRIAATMRYEDVECAEAPFDNDDDGDVVFKYSPPTTRGVPRGFEVDAMMMGMEDLALYVFDSNTKSYLGAKHR